MTTVSRNQRIAIAVIVVSAILYLGHIVLGRPFAVTSLCRLGSAEASLAFVTYKTLNVPTPIDPRGRLWTSGAVVYDEWWGWKRRVWLEDGISNDEVEEFSAEMCGRSSASENLLAYFPVRRAMSIWTESKSVDTEPYDRRTAQKRVGIVDKFVAIERAPSKVGIYLNAVDDWGPPAIAGQPDEIKVWITTKIQASGDVLAATQFAPSWSEGYFSTCRTVPERWRLPPSYLLPDWEKLPCRPLATRTLTSVDLGETWKLQSCSIEPAAQERFGSDAKLVGCDTGLNLEQWVLDAQNTAVNSAGHGNR